MKLKREDVSAAVDIIQESAVPGGWMFAVDTMITEWDNHVDGEEVSPLDEALLRKGVEWVQQESKLPVGVRRWMQEWWRTEMTGESSCGTAFCLAGYLADIDPAFEWSGGGLAGSVNSWLKEPLPEGTKALRLDSEGKVGGEYINARDHAIKSLGLLYWEAESLFAPENTAEMMLALSRAIARVRGGELGL